MLTILKWSSALVASAAFSVMAGSSASANPSRPVCTYVAGSGNAAGEVSNIKCARQAPDSAGLMTNAVWDGGVELNDRASGASVAWLVDNTGTHTDSDGTIGPMWTFTFDPGLVSFVDFKRELQSQFGFNSVYLDQASAGTPWDEVVAYYTGMSRAKH